MPERVMKIPNEAAWPLKRLNETCGLISRGKSPSYVDNSHVRAIGQRCVTAQGFNASFCRHQDVRLLAGHLVAKPGDVLLNSTGTGTIGRSAVFSGREAYIVDSHVTVLRPKHALGAWLDALLRTSWGQEHLERYCYTGSTNQIELSRGGLVGTVVPTPPLGEQRLIAKILDTLDTQIQKTEALIAKLEQIKQGLLHDLLTRGIDENGELRPPPEQAPELYKESPLGLIPREWDYASWGEHTESWAMGPRFSAARYSAEGNAATLRTTDMDSDGGINHETMPIAQLDLRGLEQHFLKRGDFVITRSGTCGVCGVFRGHRLPTLPGAFLIRFRFRPTLDPEFMALLMNSHLGQRRISRCAEGGVQKNLRGTSLCRISVATPQNPEQVEICERIGALNRNHRTLAKERLKLTLQKAALMNDLLTGRVRVTPLLEEEAQAATA